LHSKRQGLDKKEQKALTHNYSRTLSTTTTLSSLFFQLVNRKTGVQSLDNIVAQKCHQVKSTAMTSRIFRLQKSVFDAHCFDRKKHHPKAGSF
jgi:hypothetical protein